MHYSKTNRYKPHATVFDLESCIDRRSYGEMELGLACSCAAREVPDLPQTPKMRDAVLHRWQCASLACPSQALFTHSPSFCRTVDKPTSQLNLDSVSDPTHPETTVALVPGGPVVGMIRPPGSKSLTNRALVCAAFADKESTLTGALRSEDTEVMIAALESIGVNVEVSDGGRRLKVDSRNRLALDGQSDQQKIFVANSGTTIRFLTAALSAAGGHFRLHGVDRMHERPIGDLVAAISPVQAGQIKTESPDACPPVLIQSDGWNGTEIQVAGSVSSQYLSGLMMAAPIAARQESLAISVAGELVSRPYVDMTAKVMRSFGASVDLNDHDESEALQVVVQPADYQSVDYDIEPDASAASYFWAAAAISAGDVTVQGLSTNAMQGDVGFCEVLQQMGCKVTATSDSLRIQGGQLKGVDVNMNAISDTVQTLAVVALFADGPTRVRGVAHNRFKETDRIGDLARELRKLGAEIKEHEDGLSIIPPTGGQLTGAMLDTYHDHRMAMSLALAGLRVGDVHVRNPACTGKTYPEYFADMERLTGRAHRWGSDTV